MPGGRTESHYRCNRKAGESSFHCSLLHLSRSSLQSWRRWVSAVNDVINDANHARTAHKIAECHWHQIPQHIGNPNVAVQEDTKRQEIHVGDAVLKTSRDECGDGKDNRED